MDNRESSHQHWEQILRVISESATESLDQPHVVLCTDPETLSIIVSGPYPSALAALETADYEHLAGSNDHVPRKYSVTRLLPPWEPPAPSHLTQTKPCAIVDQDDPATGAGL